MAILAYLAFYGLPILLPLGAIAFIAIFFRTVVSTNETHIVQSANKTVSFGKDQAAGNVYYAWPSWIPKIGIKVIKLPVSVISLKLESYAAYDKGRVPFAIDIMAFFRIEDANTAAQRITSVQELEKQLTGILQGASRSILAGADIQEILEKRAEFGHQFTEATTEQLKAWGVANVKSIELMDIHDVEGSKVIANIMAMKQSLIDRESRVAVAENRRTAQEAEIAAKQAVETRQVQADQLVAMRGVEKERTVQISTQEATQAVREQEAITAMKTASVKQVDIVRAAEIERQKQVVQADQQKQTAVIHAEGVAAAGIAQAEGDKQKAFLIAAGDLEKSLRHADGVRAEGEAEGDALRAEQLASVTAQTTLAAAVGANDNYQRYLIAIRNVEKDQAVGIAQASALGKADIKIIANTGDAIGGVKNAMEIFTSKGGTTLGAMVEAFAQTDAGQATLSRLGIDPTGFRRPNGTAA